MDRVPGHAGDGQPCAPILWPVPKQAEACSAFRCDSRLLPFSMATLRCFPQVTIIVWEGVLLRDHTGCKPTSSLTMLLTRRNLWQDANYPYNQKVVACIWMGQRLVCGTDR